MGHLSTQSRKLIFTDAKPDRRLYEIATLAILRKLLRSGDIWVEGSRAVPMDEQLMPKPAFASLKASDDLGLGVPHDAVTYPCARSPGPRHSASSCTWSWTTTRRTSTRR